MDPYGFRQRSLMSPQFSGFNIASGAGPWATQPAIDGRTPFTGMNIMGPLNNDIPMPEVNIPESKPFTGMTIQGPLTPKPAQEDESEEDFSLFERLYNSPTPALEAYKRHIMSQPSREQHRAGKFDRVAAALTGVSEGLRKGGGAGYAASRAIVDNPYLQAMGDYQMRGQNLQELANIESTDTRNKIAGVKTMADARIAAKKLAGELARDAKLSELTDAQMAKMREELKVLGKSFQKNEATGELEVVDLRNGSRESLGKFAQTPDEKANLEVNVHGRKSGIDFGRQKAMAGVNFGFDEKMEGIRSTNRVTEHETNRKVDAANPIPTSAFDFTAPSQDSIARISAMQQASIDDPRFLQFQDENLSKRQSNIEDEPELYEDYKAAVLKNQQKILANSQRRPIAAAAAGRPSVTLPGTKGPETPQVSQSPLSAPSVRETPERAAAIAQLKNDNQPVTEEMITWMVQQLAR